MIAQKYPAKNARSDIANSANNITLLTRKDFKYCIFDLLFYILVCPEFLCQLNRYPYTYHCRLPICRFSPGVFSISSSHYLHLLTIFRHLPDSERISTVL